MNMCRLIGRLALCSLLPITGFALAQEAPQSAEFEVASVKLAAAQTGGGIFVGVRGGPGTKDPARISYVNESLRNLLAEAYGVRLYQVSGPDWIDAQRYDISATVVEGATKDQVQLMLQKLLADRFKAILHHDTRDFSVFELTVAKSGSKLRPSSSVPAPTPGNSQGPPLGSDGFPQLPQGATGMMGAMHNGISRIIAGNQTLGALAKVLENEVGTKVLDKTGIIGTYDFTLDYVRDQNRALNQFKGIPIGTAAADDSNEAPAIATALQEQLGLRLVRTKAPLDVIVLDQASKTPTEN